MRKDGITMDVVNTARAAADRIQFGTLKDNIWSIARLIADERQRCAMIAFLQAKQGSTAEQIEQAIMKGDMHD